MEGKTVLVRARRLDYLRDEDFPMCQENIECALLIAERAS